MAQSPAKSNPSKNLHRATDCKNVVINELLKQKAEDYVYFFCLYEGFGGPWEYLANCISNEVKALAKFANTSSWENNAPVMSSIARSTCERTVHALILEVGGHLIVTLFNTEELARAADEAFRASHYETFFSDETFFGEMSSDVTAVSITENDPTHQILATGFAYFFAHEWEGGFELSLYPTREARDQAEQAFESKDEDGYSIYLIGMGLTLLPQI
ncbi:hypothetical protein [Qipengyuania seohaensis]|uniref:hypothetical protein n=1 Tax=Qipengyuania seohaensis TaxID=266951 RepID=UPI000C223CDE|nr:hypothetical protein [Qipengyuania seohaensis]